MISVCSRDFLAFTFHSLHIVIIASIQIIHASYQPLFFSSQISQLLLESPLFTFSVHLLASKGLQLVSELSQSVHV